MVLSLLLLHTFLCKILFSFLLRFFKLTKFSTNQLMEHSSHQSGDYSPGLILVVNILLWSNTVFIITRHGLHGKPVSYIYRSCYLLQQCGFAKLRFKIGLANFTLNDGRYYVSQKFGHILNFFGCFDFIYADIIFRPTVQPRWHLKSFLLQKVLWKVHHHRKNKLCTKAYQHQKYQLAYYKATRCP